jgi:hypothetical protein
MTNGLMDFYLYPEESHRLIRALTDFYLVVLERAKNELQLDGIIVSDDIGTHTILLVNSLNHIIQNLLIKPIHLICISGYTLVVMSNYLSLTL